MFFWIVFVVTALVIISRVRKIISLRACPEHEDLKDYFEGRLKKRDQAEYERIIGHLGLCEKCQNRLTGMAEDGSDGQILEDHLL